MSELINAPKCPICDDDVSGFHYGVLCCESCKGFFKRTIQKEKSYTCAGNNDCPMDRLRRKRCPSCRLNKCYKVGMRGEIVREVRTRGGKNLLRSVYDEQREALRSSGKRLDVIKSTKAKRAAVIAKILDGSPPPTKRRTQHHSESTYTTTGQADFRPDLSASAPVPILTPSLPYMAFDGLSMKAAQNSEDLCRNIPQKAMNPNPFAQINNAPLRSGFYYDADSRPSEPFVFQPGFNSTCPSGFNPTLPSALNPAIPSAFNSTLPSAFNSTMPSMFNPINGVCPSAPNSTHGFAASMNPGFNSSSSLVPPLLQPAVAAAATSRIISDILENSLSGSGFSSTPTNDEDTLLSAPPMATSPHSGVPIQRRTLLSEQPDIEQKLSSLVASLHAGAIQTTNNATITMKKLCELTGSDAGENLQIITPPIMTPPAQYVENPSSDSMLTSLSAEDSQQCDATNAFGEESVPAAAPVQTNLFARHSTDTNSISWPELTRDLSLSDLPTGLNFDSLLSMIFGRSSGSSASTAASGGVGSTTGGESAVGLVPTGSSIDTDTKAVSDTKPGFPTFFLAEEKDDGENLDKCSDHDEPSQELRQENQSQLCSDDETTRCFADEVVLTRLSSARSEPVTPCEEARTGFDDDQDQDLWFSDNSQTVVRNLPPTSWIDVKTTCAPAVSAGTRTSAPWKSVSNETLRASSSAAPKRKKGAGKSLPVSKEHSKRNCRLTLNGPSQKYSKPILSNMKLSLSAQTQPNTQRLTPPTSSHQPKNMLQPTISNTSSTMYNKPAMTSNYYFRPDDVTRSSQRKLVQATRNMSAKLADTVHGQLMAYVQMSNRIQSLGVPQGSLPQRDALDNEISLSNIYPTSGIIPTPQLKAQSFMTPER